MTYVPHEFGAPQRLSRLSAYAQTLPPVPNPAGNYATVTRAGALLFTSGHTHAVGGALRFRGAIGDNGGPTLDDARECARLAVRNCLASLANHLGGLEEIGRVVQMTGYVAAHPGFEDHPRVLDAASDELGSVFGEAGLPARAAVGVASLPGQAVVEISLTVTVREHS
ncbi:RidA family protein [Sinomonas sp. RB5]